MADCSPGVAQQDADIQLLNKKTLADAFVQKLFAQQPLPNAWELLSQMAVKDALALSNRVNNNNAFADFALKIGLTAAQATANTENQQVVSPADTASSETAKGAVADAGAGIAAGTQAIENAMSDFVNGVTMAATNFAQAMSAVLTTAAGGASTPSQTQAKPASS